LKNNIIPKIALLDSGISENSKLFNLHIERQMCFLNRMKANHRADDCSDEHGHGTMCSYIIKKYAPEAIIYNFKILESNGRGESRVLLEALKELLMISIDIINLSISITNGTKEEEIEKVLKQLKEQNKIIIVSERNGECGSYPFRSNSVYGVNGKENRMLYKSLQDWGPYIWGDTTPELVLNHCNRYTWFQGNSKAAAKVSGEIAHIISQKGDFSEGDISLIQNGLEKDVARIEKNKIIDKRIQYIIISLIKKHSVCENEITLDCPLSHLITLERFHDFLMDCFEKMDLTTRVKYIEFRNVQTIRDFFAIWKVK
jgi:hypothetical protein